MNSKLSSGRLWHGLSRRWLLWWAAVRCSEFAWASSGDTFGAPCVYRCGDMWYHVMICGWFVGDMFSYVFVKWQMMFLLWTQKGFAQVAPLVCKKTCSVSELNSGLRPQDVPLWQHAWEAHLAFCRAQAAIHFDRFVQCQVARALLEACNLEPGHWQCHERATLFSVNAQGEMMRNVCVFPLFGPHLDLTTLGKAVFRPSEHVTVRLRLQVKPHRPCEVSTNSTEVLPESVKKSAKSISSLNISVLFFSQDLSLKSVDGDPGANLSHGLGSDFGSSLTNSNCRTMPNDNYDVLWMTMNITDVMQHPSSSCIAGFGGPWFLCIPLKCPQYHNEVSGICIWTSFCNLCSPANMRNMGVQGFERLCYSLVSLWVEPLVNVSRE